MFTRVDRVPRVWQFGLEVVCSYVTSVLLVLAFAVMQITQWVNPGSSQNLSVLVLQFSVSLSQWQILFLLY